MRKDILIIQRFNYNFREGFFDYLVSKNVNFKLINAKISRGKVKVHKDAGFKSFMVDIYYFFVGENYVIFPFLFFKLIKISPRVIVTEGGQNTFNNLQVLLYCRIFHRKYIVWDLGRAYADFGHSIIRRSYMGLYNLILKYCTYVFGYNSMSYMYFRGLGVDENKIIILNNTIDTIKVNTIREKSVAKMPPELMEISKGNYTYFIFVGALVKSKNIESISNLLRMLGENYYLIIVGDGNTQYMSELEQEFEGTNHLFVGYKRLEELIDYYHLAAFSILPGLGGLSINQSMAFGVPVICCAADGAEKDVIVKDQTGYIYDNLEDAYKYIILKTSEDWSSMGNKSESFLKSNFSLEQMMDKFIKYTKEI